MEVYKDKVVVITGAGGILCSMMAKEYARLGAKVAVLDLNKDAAQKVADEIVADGGVAKTYAGNDMSYGHFEIFHVAVCL